MNIYKKYLWEYDFSQRCYYDSTKHSTQLGKKEKKKKRSIQLAQTLCSRTVYINNWGEFVCLACIDGQIF